MGSSSTIPDSVPAARAAAATANFASLVSDLVAAAATTTAAARSAGPGSGGPRCTTGGREST